MRTAGHLCCVVYTEQQGCVSVAALYKLITLTDTAGQASQLPAGQSITSLHARVCLHSRLSAMLTLPSGSYFSSFYYSSAAI